MALRTIVQLIDDLDGSEIPEGEGGTVALSLDGQSFEVDLTDKNRQKLEAALTPYMEAGRKAPTRSPRTTTRSTSADAKVVRAWAKENGLQVPDRGRIPANVREAFERR